MRVAALYDIHGNLPALEAVWADLLPRQPDVLVCGGDVVSGAMPQETLAFLRSLPVRVEYVRGNADREVVAFAQGLVDDALPDSVRTLTAWVAAQLGPDDLAFMAGWPLTGTLKVPGVGTVLFCHSTPHADTPVYTRETPLARVAAYFQGVTADVVVVGHTHMSFDRQIGSVRLVNAGSVGMPYGEPGAHWLWLDGGVYHRRTAYDRVRAADRVRASACPQRDDLAASLLAPPSEHEALEVFGRLAEAQE
ncbi:MULTISPECIES: metallophosphoesterase family protein [Deinococcus]|uniref:Metallophosphoesterase family protein n=1 Tax=Deinococcus rufus TaxID=2136097 RepID=A0ABV7ZC55_9DEIO|nr:metallophosphoesterase family protein [Deinococcus sp. AB2017081]WQE94168.1 metallophosphoesterase family protein [Deinococcus sp. AB2017081]